jgi:kynurenine formamidase
MMIPKIDYIDHSQGSEQMKDFFPGVTKEQLPGGLGWAREFVTLTTHSGTHLDAPYHYHPTMDGQASLTIDEPLSGASMTASSSISAYADGDRITVEDLEKELKRISYDSPWILYSSTRGRTLAGVLRSIS